MGTSTRIDYSIRPCKHMERLMMAEAFQRFHHFRPIEDYVYVGFGGLLFVDFILFHRRVGIKQMVSIEKDALNRARYENNRPMRCIKQEFGSSETVLPHLDYSNPIFAWLDFDGQVDVAGLDSISEVVRRATSGSALSVTFNAYAGKFANDDDDDADPIDRSEAVRTYLANAVGKDRVPYSLPVNALALRRMPVTVKRICEEEIKRALAVRNASIEPESSDRVFAKQIMFFTYDDGNQMVTITWVIYKASDTARLEDCHFDSLPFTKAENISYHIRRPILTLKEIRHLDSLLPHEDEAGLIMDAERLGIPDGDVLKYRETYRYFPTYSLVHIC